MEVLQTIEEALAGLDDEQRAGAASSVLIALVFDELGLDEDDLNAAARRGLLLAAAEGDPTVSAASGSRAVLETAADLAADGYGAPLAQALVGLAAAVPDNLPLVRAAIGELQADDRCALEALALVVLHHAME
jgi:hypothetical protein